MTILEGIQEITASLSRPVTLIYADLNHANLEVDKLVNTDLPVLVVLPITVEDERGTSGILKTSFDFQAFLLNKDPDQKSADDYKAIDIETKVIAPMRLLGREFIFKATQHVITDPEGKGIEKATFQPVYSSMDANLYGVWIQAQWPVMEGLTGCVH